jgi:hypothetical protein
MRRFSSRYPQAPYTGIAACLAEFPQSYPQAVLRANLSPFTVRERTSGEAGTGRSGRVSVVSDLLSGDPAIRHTRSAFFPKEMRSSGPHDVTPRPEMGRTNGHSPSGWWAGFGGRERDVDC